MANAPKASVLIVEEGQVGAQLAEYLRARGFEVQLASTGALGLAAVQARPPSLLLCDTLLPDMNGRELVRRAREASGGRLACVLMSSVFSSVRERLDEADADVVAFLPKPLRLEDIERTLHRVLGSSVGTAAPPPATAPASAPAGAQPLAPRVGARILLEHFDARRSGVLQFRHERDEIDVTLLRGVPVNARSNLRQHTLGSYLVAVGRLTPAQVRVVDGLMRERKMRFGEALAELGFASASETVHFLRGAALARTAHAVSWSHGQVALVEDAGAAEGAALAEIDPREAILIGFAHHVSLEEAVAAMSEQRDRFVVPTAHLAALRDTVQRVLGESPLPAALEPVRRLDALLQTLQAHGALAVRHLHALWAAGLVELAAHAPGSDVGRAAADAVVQPSAAPVADSAEVAEAIFNEYLRCQGRGHYEVLGVDPAVGLTAIEAAGRSLGAQIDGWGSLRSVVLRARVEEIRGWLDRALEVLRDPEQRAAYDRALLAAAPASPAGLQDAEAEGLFRTGLDALERQDHDAAVVALQAAHRRCPDAPDYAAALGWAESRRAVHDAQRGYERLVTVCAQNPHAAQAFYYLGLLAEERGQRSNAIDALGRAVAIDPRHPQAVQALRRLRGDEPSLYRELFGDGT